MLNFYSFSPQKLNKLKDEKIIWIGFSDERLYDECAN
jgi:hypothetical protein